MGYRGRTLNESIRSGGRRGSLKKASKYFRKTVKPTQNSAKTVTTFFRALQVPPRLCAADDGKGEN